MCWTLEAPCRCCRCSAARSPPIAGWPRRRWRSWRRSFPACAARGRRALRCRAAIFRGMASSSCRAELARRYPFLADAQQRRWSAPTAHWLRMCSATRAAGGLGAASAPTYRARGRLADPAPEWARTAEDVLWRAQQARAALRLPPRHDGFERSPRTCPCARPTSRHWMRPVLVATALRRRTGCGWRRLPGRRTGRSAATTGRPPARRRRGTGSRRADRG